MLRSRLIHISSILKKRLVYLGASGSVRRKSNDQTSAGFSEGGENEPEQKSWWQTFTGPVIPADDKVTADEKRRKMTVLRDRLYHSRLSDAMSTSQWKLGQAPTTITAVCESVQIPRMILEPLDVSRCSKASFDIPEGIIGSVAVVTVGFRGASREHLEPVHNTLMDAFSPLATLDQFADAGDSKHPVLIDVSYLDSAPLSWLRRMIKPGMLEALPASVRPHAFICPQIREDITEDILAGLGVHNRAIGYTFLVDRQGYIRWGMHGQPEQEELDTVVRCTREVLAEPHMVSRVDD